MFQTAFVSIYFKFKTIMMQCKLLLLLNRTQSTMKIKIKIQKYKKKCIKNCQKSKIYYCPFQQYLNDK